jgi:CBS domain containing-hemolysin-like protein
MLIFYVFLSVFVSFTCSLLEAAILSVTPTYLAALEKRNKKFYKKISYLKDDIEKPLASILTLNTIAHTIGAAGAGAEAQKLWGNEYLSIFSAALTFVILFFSEIIPKSIGARSWKALLPISYYILRPMIIISMPVVWLSLKLSKIIKGDEKLEIFREEIPAMAKLGLNSGSIKEDEYKRLKSIIDFSNITLKDIHKPVKQVASLSANFSITESMELIEKHTYSRIIVTGLTNDDIKGYVMRKDILQSYIDNKFEMPIIDINHKILILPDYTSAQDTLDRLLQMKAHIAAIIDDFGTFIGIITLEDLIETLMGTQIYDEFDQNI